MAGKECGDEAENVTERKMGRPGYSGPERESTTVSFTRKARIALKKVAYKALVEEGIDLRSISEVIEFVLSKYCDRKEGK